MRDPARGTPRGRAPRAIAASRSSAAPPAPFPRGCADGPPHRLRDERILRLDREFTRRLVGGLDPRRPRRGALPDQGRDLVRGLVQRLLAVQERLLLLRIEDPRARDRAGTDEPRAPPKLA